VLSGGRVAMGSTRSIARFGGCPVRATSAVFAGKWKVEIVWYLAFGTKRFAELRDLLPGISEKILSSQLKNLEKDGVVQRTVTATKPPWVDYSLTEAGHELIYVMDRMCGWGTKYLGVPPTMAGRPPMLAGSL
jgi:DNA-binding HxlR family transcriptional regulator